MGAPPFPADPRYEIDTGVMRFLPAILCTTALAAAIETGVLTLLLGAANGPLPLGGWVELSVAVGWIALVTNTVFAAGLSALWLVLSRHRDAARPWPFFVFGFASAHTAWGLLNRLTLAQTWMRPPVFLTVDGLLQLAGIAFVGGLMLTAGLAWPSRRRKAVVAIVAASVVGAGLLAWAVRDERGTRVYSLQEIRAAAGGVEVAPREGRGAPLIVIGFDGLEWAIATPLLRSGDLPNLAALIREGAIGVLENGDHSFSPVIWNTLFTGRPPEEHGIYEWRNVRLPRSGQRISNLLMMPPTLHSLHGLRHLFERVPSLGLWQTGPAGSVDRRAKTLWEIGADFGKDVVVVDAPSSMPLPPIEATMISFRSGLESTFASPPELATAWSGIRAEFPEDWAALTAGTDEKWPFESRQNEFFLEILRAEHFDLVVFYSDWIDDRAHYFWNFTTPDEYLVRDLPGGWSTSVWEQSVRDHRDAPAIRAYREMDELLGELRRDHDASFVVVSDHGWSFGGYLHYGSPDGVAIFSGPAFRAGVDLAEVRIEDVLPTVLAAIGLPVSSELVGRVASEALAPDTSVHTVVSYGPPAPVAPGQTDDDPDQLERLRALGYVQ